MVGATGQTGAAGQRRGIKVDQLSQASAPWKPAWTRSTDDCPAQDSKLTEILNNLKTLNAPPALHLQPPCGGRWHAGSHRSPPRARRPKWRFRPPSAILGAASSQLAMDEFSSFIAQFPTSEMHRKLNILWE